MAEETGASPIGAMFGKNETAPAAPAEQANGSAGRPEWLPDNFWQANESGDGGSVNVEGLAKSWRDTRSALNAANEQLKARQEGADELPEQVESYWQDLDADELAEAFPKAWKASGGAVDSPSIANMMRALHKQGVGVERARAAMRDYFGAQEANLPDSLGQSEQEQLAAAIAHQGAHGQRIADDVETWLSAKHQAGAFNEEQMGVLGQLVRSGPGLGLLYGLMRQGQSSGPPVGRHSTVQIDRAGTQEELDKLMRDPDAYRTPEGRAKIERLFDQTRPELRGR